MLKILKLSRTTLLLLFSFFVAVVAALVDCLVVVGLPGVLIAMPSADVEDADDLAVVRGPLLLKQLGRLVPPKVEVVGPAVLAGQASDQDGPLLVQTVQFLRPFFFLRFRREEVVKGAMKRGE